MAEERPGSAEGAPPAAAIGRRPPPRALGEALRATGTPLGRSRSGSETPSEEDYDQNIRPNLTGAGLRRRMGLPGDGEQGRGIVRSKPAVHVVPDDDTTVQEFLEKSSHHAGQQQVSAFPPSGVFRDYYVFTHQFSAFDRKNTAATNNPFRGFYTLFWMGVALFVFKISSENWRTYGNPLGTNEIMKTMFHRDVLVLLLSDGVMCGLTGVTWLIQILTLRGFVNWDSSGWILQHGWQTAFIAGVVGWTMVRDWPWTHTVFFVLHGIVMLMKQHSYAFYNGYLSSVYAKRQRLMSKLQELESVVPTNGVSSTYPAASSLSSSHLKTQPSGQGGRRSISRSSETRQTDLDKISRAIASKKPLDERQILAFERLMRWEVDALTEELKGTASDLSKAYPANLGFIDHYKWIPLPTVVYELEYPRSNDISVPYVAEKLVAMVGVIFVMIQVSQYSIYPVVTNTIEMKERGDTLSQRFREFPWILSDLVFPFMMEYLLVWYLIWEIILNILAELTYFADRRFYDAWWNSVSWDQFAREWNRPVHVFLLRHVYHSSISSMKVNKHTATLITFFLSACVHELVMWCLFKKLRGYLLILQMCQLPLVKLSRTKWLRGREVLGNLIFWLGIFTGPSLLCSLYLIL